MTINVFLHIASMYYNYHFFSHYIIFEIILVIANIVKDQDHSKTLIQIVYPRHYFLNYDHRRRQKLLVGESTTHNTVGVVGAGSTRRRLIEFGVGRAPLETLFFKACSYLRIFCKMWLRSSF